MVYLQAGETKLHQTAFKSRPRLRDCEEVITSINAVLHDHISGADQFHGVASAGKVCLG